MALVFLHHVVGDLTLGKPELVEFSEAETVEAAVRAIGNSAEGAITVWRTESAAAATRRPPAERFVGMLNSSDVVAFLALSSADPEKAMRTPVSEVVAPNPGLLKEVDPGTSSRSIGFFNNQVNQTPVGRLRSMYRGRSAPLTCKHTSSLAAVMAQMLSHRATHVWVTDADMEDDILVGIVSYTDILNAVTKFPPP
ncbi:hypothetical protein BHE74_00050584 [Ensete ventricosum]|nr:hypothetical protein GW17_00044693 [Ensete ventricosum]RWW43721.1 hypothetical protein BHE74_00050584 [Ensete ventricosum]